jgi:hypothetical protein
MRIHRIVILSFVAAVALPQMAGAKLSMTPQALGFIEGRLDYCAKVDPKSADKYKQAEKAFAGDATKEELDKARSASEYKDAYDSSTKEFDDTPKDKVIKACTDFLAGK